MSLFGSLYTGVAGLGAQSRSMAIISDNVANVNTTGYKGSIAQFSTLVPQQSTASEHASGGVRAQSFQTVTTQGVIQTSASPLDAAISGAGFFVVNSAADGTGEQLYTRDGAFNPDALGNLTIPSGAYVQGWRLDENEKPLNLNTLQTVNVRDLSGVAAATTTIEVGANLDADSTVFAGAYTGGDMATYASTGGAAGTQPTVTRAVQVYDSLGRSHDVTLAFLRVGPANSWQAEVYAAPGEVDLTVHPGGLLAAGPVTFNGDGSLAATAIVPTGGGGAGDPIAITWAPASGAGPSTVTLDLGTVGATDGLTQFADPTNFAFVTQNGASVGELNEVRIDKEGYVVASFTNGQERRVFQLPVATFANPAGLDPRSGNLMAETLGSGSFNLHAAGTGGAGGVTPSALEGANVDLADEFTKMIVTQRAYSANAKIITTADEMLDELIRISR